MKRFVIAILAGVMVFGAVLGSAAALEVNAGVIQAGSDGVLTCTDAATVTSYGYETDDQSVSFLRVQVDEPCVGGTVMFVVVKDAAGNRLSRSNEIPVTSTQMLVPLRERVSAANLASVEIGIHTKG
jgi:hypothetical protein